METKNYVVMGCGRFGSAIAKTLFELGHEVLVLDVKEELVQSVIDQVTHAVQADCTDEYVLKSLGIGNFDVAVVCIGEDFEASIMATILVKEMGIPYVLCKASDERQAKVLYKIGADRVVFPERDMGVHTAHRLTSKNILEYIALDSQHSVAEVELPQSWNGKNLQQLNLRMDYGVNVIALKRGNRMQIALDPKEVFQSKDILVLIGRLENIERIEHLEEE